MNDSLECKKQILAALNHSKDNSFPILISYGSGTRAGQARTLIVREISTRDQCWPQFKAEEESGEIRTYATIRILWILDQQGRKIENRERGDIFSRTQQRDAEEKHQLNDVFAGATENPDKQLNFGITKLDVASNFGHCFELSGLLRRSVVICTRKESKDSVFKALNYLMGRSEGRAWNVVGCLIEAGFYVPAWGRYLETIRLEGHVLRGAVRRLRDSSSSALATDVTQYQQQLAMYDKSRLRPATEDSDSLLDRVRLFEADLISYPNDLRIFLNKCPVSLGKYMAMSSARNYLNVFPSEDMGEKELQNLIQYGLVNACSALPIDELLGKMRATELYLMLTARGVKFKKRSLQNYLAYLNLNMDDEYESALRKSAWLHNKYIFAQPPEWSWEKFQDFRTTYTLMIKSIGNWLGGRPVSSVENEFYVRKNGW